ncbi:MAG: hypothetical protein AB1918_10710 [Pseudomonadota bacterium]
MMCSVGPRPIGAVLSGVMADIALRCIHHHRRRANDTRLNGNDRAAALLEAERITATAVAVGILAEANDVAG